jgi:hypothetical protein
VIQRGDGAGFLLEAAKALRVASEQSGKNFEGDIATEARIAGTVDLADAAGAQRSLNFIGAESRPKD